MLSSDLTNLSASLLSIASEGGALPASAVAVLGLSLAAAAEQVAMLENQPVPEALRKFFSAPPVAAG